MKKFIVSALLALGVVALAHQPASAWINSRFSIGLNWDCSSGGNSFLWGLHRNGQIPGPPPGAPGNGGAPYGGAPYGGAPYGDASYGAPQGYMPAPQEFAPLPQALPQQGTMEPPVGNMPYSSAPFASGPFQFANNPRPLFYYPNAWYGGR